LVAFISQYLLYNSQKNGTSSRCHF